MAQDQHDVFSKGSPDSFVIDMLVRSSAIVGWMPIVESRMLLVKPIFMATANPCMIYPALGPE